MAVLTAQHLHRTLDAAAALAEAVAGPHLASVVLPTAAALLDGDLAVYHRIRVAPSPLEVGIFWPDAAFGPSDLAGYGQARGDHPLLARAATFPIGRAMRISELMSRRQLWATAVYAASHRGLGVEDQIAVLLGRRAGMLHAVSVCRAGRGFGETHRLLLEMLRPHLAAAVRRALASGTCCRAIDTFPEPHWTELRAPEPVAAPGALTAREGAVLDLVAEGRTSGQVARRLGIAPRTVDKHLEHAYAKLGATNRVSAVLARQRLLVGEEG